MILVDDGLLSKEVDARSARKIKDKFLGSVKRFNLKTNFGMKLRILDKRLTNIQKKTFLDALRLVSELFPDRFDIEFKLNVDFIEHINDYGANNKFLVFNKVVISKIYFIVYYPEINITNKNGKKLLLKDMYIRIPLEPSNLNKDGFVFGKIAGIRTTISTLEHQVRYFHSHLPATKEFKNISEKEYDYHPFCVGTGDIGMLTALLSESYDSDMFLSYLFMIKLFLEWESIDTNPHHHISSVMMKSPAPALLSSHIIENRNTLAILMAEGNDIPDIDWRLVGDKYEIIDDEKFNSYLVRIMENNKDRFRFSIGSLVYRDITGEYYIQGVPKVFDKLPEYTNLWIPFRGKKVYLRVYQADKLEVTNSKKYLSHKIKEDVKEYLESTANEAKIREVSISRLSSCYYY